MAGQWQASVFQPTYQLLSASETVGSHGDQMLTCGPRGNERRCR